MPTLRLLRPRYTRPTLSLCLFFLAALAGCDEKAPTNPDTPKTSELGADMSAADKTGADALVSADPQAIGLPVNQNIATTAPAPAFRVNQTGTGPDGIFEISKAGNNTTALLGQTNGSGIAVRGVATSATGRAGSFEITNSSNIQDVLFAKANGNGTAVHAVANGFGMAGKFDGIRNSGSNTLYASALGAGAAISAVNTGPGTAGMFIKTSTTPNMLNSALFAQNAGEGPALEARGGSGTAALFQVTSANSIGVPIEAVTYGVAPVARFNILNANNTSVAFASSTTGSGWAGDFRASDGGGVRIETGSTHAGISSTSRGAGPAGRFVNTTATGPGVIIQTSGGPGLSVAGGSKNAVVITATGARALYSEEATEVWFADYGFGKLKEGRARILIDPGFAQTVSLDQPYQVFVQPYGRAELYVEERTSLGFVVRLKDGDPGAEFGYRVVAKRQGFERERLERAPWADNSPAFGSHN